MFLKKVLIICFFIHGHEKKGALFLTFVCSSCTSIPVPYLISSRSLSLIKQPDTLTGGGSSSANNVLM